MSQKISKLILRDFKYFDGEYSLDFGGKHVLIYGENGSGKSSVYWALYTFFQSSFKDDASIQKYFNPVHPQTLVNRYATNPQGKISVELIDNHKRTKDYEISLGKINTNKSDDPLILEGVLGSDFITYRILSRFYDFRNSEDIDLFYVFELEILDYLVSNGKNAGELWRKLKVGMDPRPKMHEQSYKDFQEELKQFNEYLYDFLNRITQNANKFLNKDFQEKMEIRFNFQKGAYDDFKEGSTTKRNHITIYPKIFLSVQSTDNQITDVNIQKPHTFLNEARLTAIALSIRLAVIQERASSARLKILVLDDLLISLDMSHRITVSKIILEHFKDLQIFFLTHDKGFYQLLQRNIPKTDWKIFEFYTDGNKPCIKEGKDSLGKAEEFLTFHDYEACSNYLRKEVEEILKRFLDPDLHHIMKEFKSLEELLKLAKSKYIENRGIRLKKIFGKSKMTSELAAKLKTDFENDTELDANQKGILKGLRMELFALTFDFYKEGETQEVIFDELKKIKDRVLNPASHHSEAPIFRKELEDAILLVKKLADILKSSNRK